MNLLKLPVILWVSLAGVLVALLTLHAPANAQAPTPPASLVYAQNFQNIAPGGPLPPGVYDNTYTGLPTPMQVVKSGNPRLGSALKAKPHGFAQIVLGEMSLKKNALYRISLDVSSLGPQKITLMLRYIPAPYTGYIASDEQVNETLRHVSFVGRAPEDAAPVGLFLIMNGFTTLTIGNIKVETVPDDAVVQGGPPTPGNLIPNGGFEIGGDGWFTRGPVEFVARPDAYEGRRVAVLHGVADGQDIVSSTYLRLSFQSDYLAQVRLRALSDSATAQMFIAGKMDVMTLKKSDGWQTMTFRFRPQQSPGKIVPYLDTFLSLVCQAPGMEMLVDGASVRAAPPGVNDFPFVPKAALELALSSDTPEGVITRGEAVRVTALASIPLRAARLQIRDEENKIVRQVPLSFQGQKAQVLLRGLPCGYWHLLTAGTPAGSIPGETFVAVVPPQPNLPPDQRFFGTHIPDDPAMRQACWKLGLRWSRLHDTSQTVKWPTIQPDSPDQWLWHDDSVAHQRTEGEALMGNIDLLPAWAPKQAPPGAPPIPPGTVTGLNVMTPGDEALWQDYCARVAAHYRGRINCFEITNETSFYMSPAQYLHVLQIAAAGIRSGNPQATIAAPAVAGSVDSDWLLNLVALGTGKYCDAVTYHGYALDTWAALAGPDSLRVGVAKLRAALARAGTPNLPIWDGETGVSGIQSAYTKYYLPSYDAGAMETAQMFPKSAACAKAGGISRIFYYAAFQPTVADGDGSGLFSFGDVNRVLKMPFQPLGVAVSFLEGRRFLRQDAADQSRDIIHLVYSGRGQTVHVLWKLTGSAEISVPHGAQVVNMWGRSVAQAGRTLLTQEPVYFVVPQQARTAP